MYGCAMHLEGWIYTCIIIIINVISLLPYYPYWSWIDAIDAYNTVGTYDAYYIRHCMMSRAQLVYTSHI